MKIVSWNVNGIAACRRKGLLKFISDIKADVLCLQEIKTQCPLRTPGYFQYWNPAQRPGYAGTLTLTRKEPRQCITRTGVERFDIEGRMIALEYRDFFIVYVYVPSYSTYSDPARLQYRINWEQNLRDFLRALPKPAILCGDFNVAYAHIDSYPENQKNLPDNPIDLFSLLSDLVEESPAEESPYLGLREYFRLCERAPVRLTFEEIETLLGDSPDWEAYYFESFWYDDTPEHSSYMWAAEGFPSHVFRFTTPEYCIAESWQSQGYEITRVSLSGRYALFRRTIQNRSGLVIPKALVSGKLPDKAVHEARQFFAYLIKKYGL